MIRINLLGGERKTAGRIAAFGPGQRGTALCVLVLVGALVGVGWWYRSLSEAASQVDAEISAAEQEANAKIQAESDRIASAEATKKAAKQAIIDQAAAESKIKSTVAAGHAAAKPQTSVRKP